MRAVVMAGGEGTRLRPMTANQPKPLLPVVNQPIMGHVLRLLRRHGVTETVVTVQFLASLVRNYFGDGDEFGMTLSYATEETPLGTAGSVKNAEVGAARRAVHRDQRRRADRHRPDRHDRLPPAQQGAGDHRAQAGGRPGGVRHHHRRRGGPHRALPGEADLGPGVLGHGQHRRLHHGARGPRPRRDRASPSTGPATSSPSCWPTALRCTATSPRPTGRTSATTRATCGPRPTSSTV